MRETWVQSLGREDSPGEGNGNPIFLPGKSHGRRSLVGYSPRGCKESDTTELLHFHFHSWETLWTARRSNQLILKEINPEYSLEGLMMKLKFQYFGNLMQRANSLQKLYVKSLHTMYVCTKKIFKIQINLSLDAGKDWRQEEKGTTVDKMVGWHHQLKGHEFEQAPAEGKGQGRPACCSPWSCKESDTTEQLNWTELR